MKPTQYAALRRSVGTQAEVARMLGVHPITVSQRERGASPITPEAALAMRKLAEEASDV